MRVTMISFRMESNAEDEENEEDGEGDQMLMTHLL
jgi:hypothetical protein